MAVEQPHIIVDNDYDRVVGKKRGTITQNAIDDAKALVGDHGRGLGRDVRSFHGGSAVVALLRCSQLRAGLKQIMATHLLTNHFTNCLKDTGPTHKEQLLRGRRQPPFQCWKMFLRNHANAIATIDLCIVPTAKQLLTGLKYLLERAMHMRIKL